MISSFLPGRLFRFAARCMLALLFFSQGAMLAHSCTAAERAAAFAAAEAAPARCHEAVADASAAADKQTASCLTHCSSAHQSPDTPQVAVAAMPAGAVLTVPAAIETSPLGRVRNYAPPPTGDPPIAIRFQVFRT